MDEEEPAPCPEDTQEPRQPPHAAGYRPGQRVTLNDLSNEVLSTIVGYIRIPLDNTDEYETHKQYHQGVKALHHLALCSHRLHQIAEPVLYQEFKEPGWIARSNDTLLVKFMCAIIARPHLRTRVKHFRGRARHCIHDQRPPSNRDDLLNVSEVTEDNWTRIKAAVDSVTSGDGAFSFKGLEEGCWEAVTALVLCLLPNIEFLEFHDWGVCEYHSLEAIFSCAASSQESRDSHWKVRPLGHLSHYSLRYWDTEGGLGLADGHPLLELKTLRSISMHSVATDCYGEDDDDDGTIEYEKAGGEEGEEFHWSELDHVTSISLTNSALDHSSFKAFLHCFPKLESLTYEYGGATTGYATFEPPRIMRALREVRHSLQELQLYDDTGGDGWDTLAAYPIGSLNSFSRLKHIRISAPILLGGGHPSDEPVSLLGVRPRIPTTQTLIDSLPESLESLTLHDCREWDVPLLFDLVSHASNFKAFAWLDLGWGTYDEVVSSSEPASHPGFTQVQAKEFLSACIAAGWSIKMITIERPMKVLHGWIREVDSNEEKVGGSGNAESSSPVYEMLHFPYPYDRWEEFCKKFNCDLETGRRLDD